jgi:hypothetical protein
MVRVTKFYDVVHGALGKGPRTTDEIIAECRRPGVSCRAETIQLFLRLSREIEYCDGLWYRRSSSKQQRIQGALQKAFASGGTYIPLDRLTEFLDEQEPVTQEDIAIVCEESGQYSVQGRFILRT